MTMNVPENPLPPSPRKKRRWWFYALIAVGSLILATILGVVVLIGYAKSLVTKYTSTTMKPVPQLEYDPAAQKELQKKWEVFAHAIMNRQNPPPFRITTRDINAFLAQNKEMRGRVYCVITNGQVQAQFSMPLDQTRRPELKGRHLNGVADINLVFQDGWLTISLGEVRANGKPLPGWAVKRLQGHNFVKHLDRDRRFVTLMQEIDTIEVRDGEIVISPLP